MRVLAVASILLGFAFGAALPSAEYTKEIDAFRAAEEKDIAGEYGWASLVGLYWLKEGTSRIGSDPKADVPLPASVPAWVGTLRVTRGQVEFKPEPGIKIPGGVLKEDAVMQIGTVKFVLIRRTEKVGIRVKDPNSPTRKEFTHLRWFPLDTSWRINAKFVPFDKPRKVTVDTVVPGIKEEFDAPGTVVFQKDGHEYSLEPLVEDNELFYIFRDRTSGKTTYGAARYMYSAMPKNGTVLLDFNKAASPPCAFTAFATCPLPPPSNRLTLEVTAGEMSYSKGH